MPCKADQSARSSGDDGPSAVGTGQAVRCWALRVGTGAETPVVGDVSGRESTVTEFRGLEAGAGVGHSRGVFGAEAYMKVEESGWAQSRGPRSPRRVYLICRKGARASCFLLSGFVVGSRSPHLAPVCWWPCYLVVYIALPRDSEGRCSSLDPALNFKPSRLGGPSPNLGPGHVLPEWGSLGTAKVGPGGQGHFEDLGRGKAMQSFQHDPLCTQSPYLLWAKGWKEKELEFDQCSLSSTQWF